MVDKASSRLGHGLILRFGLLLIPCCPRVAVYESLAVVVLILALRTQGILLSLFEGGSRGDGDGSAGRRRGLSRGPPKRAWDPPSGPAEIPKTAGNEASSYPVATIAKMIHPPN